MLLISYENDENFINLDSIYDIKNVNIIIHKVDTVVIMGRDYHIFKEEFVNYPHNRKNEDGIVLCGDFAKMYLWEYAGKWSKNQG